MMRTFGPKRKGSNKKLGKLQRRVCNVYILTNVIYYNQLKYDGEGETCSTQGGGEVDAS
jgi:hypothetical protein